MTGIVRFLLLLFQLWSLSLREGIAREQARRAADGQDLRRPKRAGAAFVGHL